MTSYRCGTVWLLLVSFVVAHALPLVDPGLFVIMGVRTCRAGDGYCLLGQDCTLDEDFLPDDQGGHCEGLRNAFTPSAHFICCKYNPSNTTQKPTTASAKDVYITSEEPMPVENPTINQVLEYFSVSTETSVVTEATGGGLGESLGKTKGNVGDGMAGEKNAEVDAVVSIVDEDKASNRIIEPIVEPYEKIENEYAPVVEDVADDESKVNFNDDAEKGPHVEDMQMSAPIIRGNILLSGGAEIVPELQTDLSAPVAGGGIDAIFGDVVSNGMLSVDASNDWSPIINTYLPSAVLVDTDNIKEIELDVKIPMETREDNDEQQNNGSLPIAIIASKAKESEQLNLIQRDQRIS